MNTAGRKYCSGAAFICAGRRRSDCSQAFLSMTPIARASAGLLPAGMFRASTLPDSISSSRGGKLWRTLGPKSRLFVFLWTHSWPLLCGSAAFSGGGGGQNTRATSGRSEYGQENRDALDDARPDFVVDHLPVVLIPAIDGFDPLPNL